MLFKNAYIFTPDRGFIRGGFAVENGRFTEVFSDRRRTSWPWEEDVIDLQCAYVLPGLVDAHIHGAVGADFSDGDLEGLTRMGRYLARCGVTSFAPTSMTLPYETLAAAFSTARVLKEQRPADCARVVGIHMEGPFFSEKKKGAQNGAYLRLPDFEAFKALYEGCGGLVRIVDVAPELAGAADFTERAKTLCTVSVAHTDATYEQARVVFEAGASHLTHLFNAMPSIHHRKPGVIGAASEDRSVVAELICDGLHVHPSAVRMAFKLFPGRVCLISDALRCCGMPDGGYELGGQQVFLNDGEARLADGTIAGAASNLFQDLHKAATCGFSLEEVIPSATLIPARELGVDDEVGSIAPGRYADFLVCDGNLGLRDVYLGGVKL
ncbi:MAG: N-acetylglucosamine-6-phosphate deacetylase [Oscillospiraceae bacterium]|nr:N-acetylglucosamine-6-phosphate deacetylase [Oscillospiraceae bacterium]